MKSWTLFWYDIKNWLFWKMSQIIEPLLNVTEFNFSKNMIHWKEPFFQTWLKELNPSVQHDSKNWILHSFQHDSKNWTLFPYCSMNLIIFLNILKELNHFSSKKYNSKNWTILQYDSKNWTLFSICLKELNFFEYDSKIWTFFNVIQIIEPYF